MTKPQFAILEITNQWEIIENKGKFIRTETTFSYIYDTYNYDDYFVVFFCLIVSPGEINCRCFASIENIRYFINSIDRPMS